MSVQGVPGQSVTYTMPSAADKRRIKDLANFLRNPTTVEFPDWFLKDQLCAAVAAGNADLVSKLLEDGVLDINQRDAEGKTLLFIAASNGHVDVVKVLLQVIGMRRDALSGFELRIVEDEIHKAFFLALDSGNMDLVRCFIQEARTVVDRVNDLNQTLLSVAAEKGDVDVVRCLVEEGLASVNLVNSCGETALYFAASKGHENVVRYLATAGALLVGEPAMDGFQPLHKAAIEGHATVVCCLIELGVSVDQLDAKGDTALHLAAYANHVDVVSYLLTARASVTQKDSDGATVLHLAVNSTPLDLDPVACENRLELVRCLVTAGAGALVNEQDGDGATALHLAAARGYQMMTYDLMLAGVKCLDEAVTQQKTNDSTAAHHLAANYRTALHLAASNGREVVVKCLIELGLKDGDRTALRLAAEAGHLKVVRYLVNTGGRLNDMLMTLWSVALETGQVDLIRYLKTIQGISDGSMNMPDRSILSSAAHRNHLNVVRYLVEECKVSIDQSDAEGRTPLQRAASAGNADIVRYFLEECIAEADRRANSILALYIATCDSQVKVVRYLMEKGEVSTNERIDVFGLTALHYAAMMGCLEMVRCLVEENRALVNQVVDSKAPFEGQMAELEGQIAGLASLLDGQTALDIAAERGHVEVIRYLVNEAKAKTIVTAFFRAAYQGHKEVVRYFVEEAQVPVNALNNGGETALYLAALRGKESVVRYLVEEANALVNHRSNGGLTALERASKEGHTGIVRYLFSTGKVVITPKARPDERVEPKRSGRRR